MDRCMQDGWMDGWMDDLYKIVRTDVYVVGVCASICSGCQFQHKNTQYTQKLARCDKAENTKYVQENHKQVQVCQNISINIDFLPIAFENAQ